MFVLFRFSGFFRVLSSELDKTSRFQATTRRLHEELHETLHADLAELHEALREVLHEARSELGLERQLQLQDFLAEHVPRQRDVEVPDVVPRTPRDVRQDRIAHAVFGQQRDGGTLGVVQSTMTQTKSP